MSEISDGKEKLEIFYKSDINGISDINEAKEEYKKMLAEFGKYEHELKTYYDQHMLGMAFDGCFRGHVDIMNIGG